MKAVYQLTRPALLWQLLMVVAVLLPHSQRLPWWLPLMTLGALGWRLWVHLGRTSFPHWSVKFMMAVTAGIGVVMSIGFTAIEIADFVQEHLKIAAGEAA
jgi:hypothetical protein